jgi:ribosome-binding protein aMBF1 (putative translation factor)
MSFLHRMHIPPSPDAAAAAALADSEVDIPERVARNMIRLRNQRGLSLLALSALSHIDYWTLQEAELGRELPSVEVLWKLARALKVSCDTFLEAPAAPGQTGRTSLD